MPAWLADSFAGAIWKPDQKEPNEERNPSRTQTCPTKTWPE